MAVLKLTLSTLEGLDPELLNDTGPDAEQKLGTE